MTQHIFNATLSLSRKANYLKCFRVTATFLATMGYQILQFKAQLVLGNMNMLLPWASLTVCILVNTG